MDFDNLPETNFSCLGKVIGGYYADVETGCQMFHVCTIGQKDEIMDIKFLCLNGTVFDQETRVCERVDEVDCSKSERFYNLNLELYGNNAVTLSLNDVPDDEGDPTESIDEQHSTTARPTTTTTTTTTQRPTNPPATATTTIYHQQNTGYPQHYQTSYSTPQTSQSKSLYDDKNSGFHHQYIFHNGEQANNQATSFQLFSNQGVGSTTNQPQVHQARYGTTSSPQIILNGPSTPSPLFHGVSSTIQTLLNSHANNPSFINPLFHNHGIPSTTEHYTVHSNNPRETQEYHEDGEQSEARSRRPLEAVQSTSQGKISKLSISPVPVEAEEEDEDAYESVQKPTPSSHGSKISTVFLPTPTTPEPTTRSFYPTPRTSPKSESGQTHITRHIHLSPQQPIPQLKPQQITINLPPPDIQRIVQNPSPLLPSQSRVIITAKASVSDESGRPLNTSELVVLPLPTIPTSYDDYKEGDESFDPFYRDVPKIGRSRSSREVGNLLEKAEKVHLLDRRRRALRRLKRAVIEDQSEYEDDEELAPDYEYPVTGDSLEDEDTRPLLTDSEEAMDIATIKANFKKFKALLLGRRMSGEVSSEKKSSKEHFGGVKSKSIHDEVELNKEIVEKDDESSLRKEEKPVQSESKDDDDLTHDYGSNVDGDSANSNNDEELDAQLMSMMKTSEVEEKDDAESETVTEAQQQSATESPSHAQETDDQPIPSVVESDMEQSSKSQSVTDDEESIDMEDSENKGPAKSMEPLEDAKEATAEEEVNTKKIVEASASATEEDAGPKSALTTIESDAEEYIESESIPNTKESDLEEYVESKSAPTAKEADVEESIDPETNAKESDSKEWVRPKSPVNTVASDTQEVIEDSGKPAPTLDTQKSRDGEALKSSDAEEYVENKYVPITNDEVIHEITSETNSTEAAEEVTSEKQRTTETTTEKVETEPKTGMDQTHQKIHQESIDSSNHEEDNIEDDGVKSEIASEVGELKEEEIKELTAEKTDAVTDVEEDKTEKGQVSNGDDNGEFESVDSKPEENSENHADVTSKDPDVTEDINTQPERSEAISKLPQGAKEFVTSDNMKLRGAEADQKPEVKEKSTDHAIDKNPDSLVEKVESATETKDSSIEEKSEKPIKSEQIKDPKLLQVSPQKSKPMTSGSPGWKPNKARTSTSHSLKTEDGTSFDDITGPRPGPQSSKDVNAKAEAAKNPKFSKIHSKNGVDIVDDKTKTKSSKGSIDDEEYVNDAQLSASKEENGEEHAGKTKSFNSNESATTSESPNKIPSDQSDCEDSSENVKESSYEDSRGEYDDYTSEEYISGSRESEPYETSSEEPTSEYTDSRDDSRDEYSSTEEDYAPLSGEVYSKEDSKPTVSSEDYSTEGVLKFTDEIPEPKSKHSKPKNRAATRAKVSSEDYVDDNYEPEHYRENSAEKNHNPVDTSDEKDQKVSSHSSAEQKLNDEAVDVNSTTTTTTEPTTTTTTTTTTARPTPPSLFRPFSVRKNYKYIPPTTTPNPVVIKHRFGLLNPRPAKPKKTYNELAPRPVIRKSPLVGRKPYGTGSTTVKSTISQRRLDDFEDSSEIIWTSTEYIDEDEKPRESKLTRSANDVSFNDTAESSESEKEESVPAVDEESLSKNSTTENNDVTGAEEASGTQATLSTTAVYLSTPYPLLKATTSGNLIIEEAKDGKFADEKVVQIDKPATEELHSIRIEGSSEAPESTTSSTTTATSTFDEKPPKFDEDHEIEEPKISKVPFSCIGKEPYRFYGDPRDCRLFHYCSPGFTARQMLDFRFVCEDTTMFDEVSQSCRHGLENPKCANRQW